MKAPSEMQVAWEGRAQGRQARDCDAPRLVVPQIFKYRKPFTESRCWRVRTSTKICTRFSDIAHHKQSLQPYNALAQLHALPLQLS